MRRNYFISVVYGTEIEFDTNNQRTMFGIIKVDPNKQHIVIIARNFLKENASIITANIVELDIKVTAFNLV